jgi:hypothetical protein
MTNKFNAFETLSRDQLLAFIEYHAGSLKR